MSEMVERVARALWSGSVYHGYNAETLEMDWLRNAGIYRSQARAAIEALREPTPEMNLAGNNKLYVTGYEGAADIYQDMLSAALGPEVR